MDLEKLFKFLGITDESDSATVGGWVLEKFGYFPKADEEFEFENITVHILDADDQRVNEITVTLRETEQEEEKE